MAKKLTIRKGCKARYVKTHYNLWGSPISTTNEVVTIIRVTLRRDAIARPTTGAPR